jgi:hypothetical protein
MKTMAFNVVGGILVVVHGNETPADSEWQQYVTFIDKQGSTLLPQLVDGTSSGGPSAKQRRELTAMLNGRKVPVAVLTDSTITLGIVTAVSWFNDKLKAFSPRDGRAAFTYLGVPQALWPQVEAEQAKMRKELGLSATFAR